MPSYANDRCVQGGETNEGGMRQCTPEDNPRHRRTGLPDQRLQGQHGVHDGRLALSRAPTSGLHCNCS